MFDDVIALQDFYKTSLGLYLAGQLQPLVSSFWQSGPNSCNMMLGYGIDWLSTGETSVCVPTNLVSMMPSRSGVIAWPFSSAKRSTLVDTHALPLPDVQVDRLLLAHMLEFDPEPGRLLEECWRVLDGTGKVLVVVPNRRGLWARLEYTPLGHGRPYSSRQLCQILKSHGFLPRVIRCVGFLPPFNNQMLMRFASSFERFGKLWWPALGGVLLVEADKILYATSGNSSNLRRRPVEVVPTLATFVGDSRKGCM